MYRAISLLIVLAHLCVASTPCFDADLDSESLLRAAAQASRARSVQPLAMAQPAVVVPPSKPATIDPHHGHHAQAARATATATAPKATEADHSHHAHHAPVPKPAPTSAHAHHGHGHGAPPARVAAPTPPPVASDLQLSAQCMCGCSKGGGTAGTTTSPRIGFALLSAPPTRLLELTPSFEASLIQRWPAPVAAAFDHVPILS